MKTLLNIQYINTLVEEAKTYEKDRLYSKKYRDWRKRMVNNDIYFHMLRNEYYGQFIEDHQSSLSIAKSYHSYQIKSQCSTNHVHGFTYISRSELLVILYCSALHYPYTLITVNKNQFTEKAYITKLLRKIKNKKKLCRFSNPFGSDQVTFYLIKNIA